MEQGPVIAAIDAGHMEHGGKCVACSGGVKMITEHCGVVWPCQFILAARNQQRVYAERLRQRRADQAGQLSSLAVR